MIALVESNKTDTVISESQTVKSTYTYTEDEDEYMHELIGYDDEDNMKNYVPYEENIIKSSCKKELMLYRNSPPLLLKTNKMYNDPLQWWKQRANDLPILSKLARFYLSIQATSAPSERIFSLASIIITRLRSRLDPEVSGSLVFLNRVLLWEENEL